MGEINPLTCEPHLRTSLAKPQLQIRGQADVPFASVCRIEWVENAVTHPSWIVILVRVAILEGYSHTSITISGQPGVSLPRHRRSCWKGKHDTVYMYEYRGVDHLLTAGLPGGG